MVVIYRIPSLNGKIDSDRIAPIAESPHEWVNQCIISEFCGLRSGEDI